MAENEWETGVTTYNPYKWSYTTLLIRGPTSQNSEDMFFLLRKWIWLSFNGGISRGNWWCRVICISWKLQGCCEEICLVQSCPKLGTIKIHWKFIVVERKKQTGIDAMLQESLWDSLSPRKPTFSHSAFPFPGYFRHSFQPSAIVSSMLNFGCRCFLVFTTCCNHDTTSSSGLCLPEEHLMSCLVCRCVSC